MAQCSLKFSVDWAWWWPVAKWPAAVLVQFQATAQIGHAIIGKAVRLRAT